MNDSLKILLLCLLSLVLFNCKEKNTRDIHVSGSIIDSLSGQPIENAKVTVLCWYDAGWEKTDYETRDIITGTDGYYEANFEEGYKVIVASVAPEHKKAMHIVNNLNNSKIKIGLKLRQDSALKRLSEINLGDYILSDSDSW